MVLNTKLLKDLAKLTGVCQTGRLDVYPSMMLKYCSKFEHFLYHGTVARTQLAALDNNGNAGRGEAQVQLGEQAGEARYKCQMRVLDHLHFLEKHSRYVLLVRQERNS